MATTAVTLNGVTYFIPQPGEQGPTYDQDLTNYLIALATAFPQGGASPSSTFQVLTSATGNPATGGNIRLGKTDLIDWRNNANISNLPLGIDTLDNLTFNATLLTGQTCAIASNTTAQTGITTATTIKFDNVEVNIDTAYNSGTGIFTVPTGKGGRYLVAVSLRGNQVTAPGTWFMDLRLNSGIISRTQSNGNVAVGTGSLAASIIMNASAAATIDFQMTTTGGTFSTNAADAAARICIQRLV